MLVSCDIDRRGRGVTHDIIETESCSSCLCIIESTKQIETPLNLCCDYWITS